MGGTVDEPKEVKGWNEKIMVKNFISPSHMFRIQLPCSEIKRPNTQSKLAFPSIHISPRTLCPQIPNTQSHLTFGSMWHMACLQMLKVTPIKDIEIKNKGNG